MFTAQHQCVLQKAKEAGSDPSLTFIQTQLTVKKGIRKTFLRNYIPLTLIQPSVLCNSFIQVSAFISAKLPTFIFILYKILFGLLISKSNQG